MFYYSYADFNSIMDAKLSASAAAMREPVAIVHHHIPHCRRIVQSTTKMGGESKPLPLSIKAEATESSQPTFNQDDEVREVGALDAPQTTQSTTEPTPSPRVRTSSSSSSSSFSSSSSGVNSAKSDGSFQSPEIISPNTTVTSLPASNRSLFQVSRYLWLPGLQKLSKRVGKKSFLEKRLGEVTEQSAMKDELMQEKMQQVIVLTHEMEDANCKLAKKDEQIVEETQQNALLKQQVEELNRKLAEHDELAQQTTQQNFLLSGKLEEAKRQLSHVQSALSEDEKLSRKYRVEKGIVMKRLDKAKSQLVDEQNALSGKKEELRKASEQLVHQKAALKDKEELLKVKTEDNAYLEKQRGRLSDSLAREQTSVIQKHKLVKKLEGDITALATREKDTLRERDEVITQLHDQLKELQEREAASWEQNERKILELQSAIDTLQADMAKSVLQKDNQIAVLESIAADKDAQIGQLNQMVQNKEAWKEGLDNIIQEQSKELETQKEGCNKLEKKVAELRATTERELAEKEVEVATLRVRTLKAEMKGVPTQGIASEVFRRIALSKATIVLEKIRENAMKVSQNAALAISEQEKATLASKVRELESLTKSQAETYKRLEQEKQMETQKVEQLKSHAAYQNAAHGRLQQAKLVMEQKVQNLEEQLRVSLEEAIYRAPAIAANDLRLPEIPMKRQSNLYHASVTRSLQEQYPRFYADAEDLRDEGFPEAPEPERLTEILDGGCKSYFEGFQFYD